MVPTPTLSQRMSDSDHQIADFPWSPRRGGSLGSGPDCNPLCFIDPLVVEQGTNIVMDGHASCIDGQDEVARLRVEAALRDD